MPRIARVKPAQYWEHTSVCVDIHEAHALLGALKCLDLTDAYSGACVNAKAKLLVALSRMQPKADVCASCRHHKGWHEKKRWFKPGQACGGNWPEQGPCKCKRFRGQR